MTTEEFSNEFEVLLNSYALKQPNTVLDLQFDEYEKSVFLTKAQEDLVISIYDGKNPYDDSFEKTEEVRRGLSALIETYTISQEKSISTSGLTPTSKFYAIPNDLWFITYESATISDNSLGPNPIEAMIYPITQDDFYRVNRNPFRNSNEKRILRLDVDSTTIELISKYSISRYLVRYLRKPSPIIIVPLTDGLTINGVSVKTECELNPVIHRAILEKAVKYAYNSRLQNTGK